MANEIEVLLARSSIGGSHQPATDMSREAPLPESGACRPLIIGRRRVLESLCLGTLEANVLKEGVSQPIYCCAMLLHQRFSNLQHLLLARLALHRVVALAFQQTSQVAHIIGDFICDSSFTIAELVHHLHAHARLRW